jgi:hypothetical protein
MNNRRTLVIMAAIFAALAVITLLQNQQISQYLEVTPTAIATATAQLVFPDMAETKIQAIRLEAPQVERSFTIARAEDGTWTSPESTQTLNEEVAAALAHTMVLLPYSQSLPLTDDLDLQTYGFLPSPRLIIQVIMSNGDTHFVAVGSPTPSQAAFYALVDERDTIYLLEPRAVAFLVTTLESAPLT